MHNWWINNVLKLLFSIESYKHYHILKNKLFNEQHYEQHTKYILPFKGYRADFKYDWKISYSLIILNGQIVSLLYSDSYVILAYFVLSLLVVVFFSLIFAGYVPVHLTTSLLHARTRSTEFRTRVSPQIGYWAIAHTWRHTYTHTHIFNDQWTEVTLPFPSAAERGTKLMLLPLLLLPLLPLLPLLAAGWRGWRVSSVLAKDRNRRFCITSRPARGY